MPTKTPREKIHELIKPNYNENIARCVVALVMPVFDALLEEARQDMKEKCLKCVPLGMTYYDDLTGKDYRDGYNQGVDDSRKSIQSL